jgi:hypothetical protein
MKVIVVVLEDLKRAVFSKAFFISVSGSVLAGFFGGFELMTLAFSGRLDAAFGAFPVTLVFSSISSDVMLLAAPVLCTIPYAGMLVDEYKSRYLRLYLPRAGKNGYIAGKTIALPLSGGLALFAGTLLLLALYGIAFLAYNARPSGMAVDPEFVISMPLLLARMLLFSLFGCFWALVGAGIALTGNNKFLAYVCPFVIVYFLLILKERYFRDIRLLDPREWVMFHEEENVALSFLFMITITLATAAIYTVLIRRRLRDV